MISSPWLKKILKFIPFKCSKLNEMTYVQSCRAPWEYLLPIGAPSHPTHQKSGLAHRTPLPNGDGRSSPLLPPSFPDWGSTTQYKKCQSRMQKILMDIKRTKEFKYRGRGA